MGDGRASAAVAEPFAPGQADSALAAARQDMRRVQGLSRPLDARAGRVLAGTALTDLAVQGRNVLARSAMADEIRPPLGMPVPGGLPGGGPSARQRARDRAVHAATMEMFARVEARARRRADSLAWLAESARAGRAAAPRPAPQPPPRPAPNAKLPNTPPAPGAPR